MTSGADKRPTTASKPKGPLTAFSGLGHTGQWAQHLGAAQERSRTLQERTVQKATGDADH